MAPMNRAFTSMLIALSLACLGGDCKKGPPKPKLMAPASESADAALELDSQEAAEAPMVALLATEGTFTRLYHATPRSHGEELARFRHLEGDVRAALLSDGRVAATARHLPLRDPSFDGALFVLDGEATLVCDGLLHASAPLALPDGSVLVARGEAGPARDPDLRIDSLGIDRLAPDGQLDRLHGYEGHLLHLAGWSGREVIVYRVGPEGADLVALDPHDGSLRILVDDLPPFARDFSVDADRLVYRGRDDHDSRLWVVESLDLATSQRTRLHESERFALAPHRWRDGGVAINEGDGLVLLGSSDPVARPMGPGVDLVRDFSADGRWVVALHTVVGAQPTPFVIDTESGDALEIAAPEGTRITVAGFVQESP
jgi:hypothetical protein